ncbi:MAG: hypothetical protein Q8N78_05215 [Sulfurimonas sp.]|nr:hypothetical protein [Sulfurimonas sp.]
MEEELKNQIIELIEIYEKKHIGVYVEHKISDYSELNELVLEILDKQDVQVGEIYIARYGMPDINSTVKFPGISVTIK